MNFVGHAHVARALGASPAIVLGAMLPDFASMCRARVGAIGHEGISEGVALHHRTDDAFHSGPAFLALCSRTSVALEERGLSWGASRAVAHVGTELLLDGFLLDDARTVEAYVAAIDALVDPALGGSLRLEGRGADRFPALAARVHAHGIPHAYRDPVLVADRLIAILAPRPRLVVHEAQRGALVDAIASLQREVARSVDDLVSPTRSVVLDSRVLR